MALTVNGQIVPDEQIRHESDRLAVDPRWNGITDEGERARLLCQAAELSAVHQVLLEQQAASDPRPVDSAVISQEIERLKADGRCRPAFDDSHLRRQLEQIFRVDRLKREFVANAAQASEAELETFYAANRDNFRSGEMFHAAHIVRHVNERQLEDQARAAIEAALAELDRGIDFGVVAESYSDCKGNGGDLGRFAAGYMVDEFERAIRSLEPGQRTGVFTTPFGFHIAELRGKWPGGPAEFEDVREDIARVFQAMAEHREYLCQMETLRTRADIRRLPDSASQSAASAHSG
ncbi:MAG: peptidylprolyl isomerase [Bryobacteraceae bacterium]